MPVVPTYPGVYIEEIPSGVHTITGVATSIAAFIDFFTMGPLNKAVQILSWADFQRQFGDLNAQSEASYAIRQFFLNGGSEAWVVRVASKLDNTGKNDPTRASVPISDTLNGTAALTISAISEGSWGNTLRAEIDPNVSKADEFNLNIAQYRAQGNSFVLVQQEVFRNLSVDSAKSNFVEAVVNDDNTGSTLARVEVNTSNVQPPLANGTLTGTIAQPDKIQVSSTPTVTVTLNGTTYPASPLTLPGNPTLPVDLAITDIAPILQDAIRTAVLGNTALSGATVEVIGGNQLQVLSGPGNPSDSLTFTTAGFDVQAGGGTENVRQYTLGNPNKVANSAQLAGTQGMDGVPPGANELIGNQAGKTGIYALEDVDLFNLLCIPRAAITSGSNSPLDDTQAGAVITIAEQYCATRRAFFLIDTPLGYTKPSAIKAWLASHDTLRDKNAALYYPRVQVPDPLNGFRLRSLGASGTIAGLCARIDTTRGVWKAPAGTEATLTNVAQLDYTLTDAENGVLNPLAINCLRTFPVYGSVCWGARTLEGADQLASEWKYVPVRRFTLFLEESLYRGTKWVVFEPNDEPLWAQIRLNIGAFLQNLFRQGAFQGSTPRQAYFVKCDGETTTQNDIDNGIVNIVVGFAPLKPAEFVILKIQQIAGQIQT